MAVVPIAEVKRLVSEGLPDWIAEQPELRRRLREAVAEPPRPLRQKMTYAEFLAWADEDTLAEWVDGEVIMASPASNQHQDLVRFLTTVLGIFAEQRNLGIVRPAPFQIKLEHGREPDVLFVCRANLARLKETWLDGPADLAIEIVSPESVGRDRGEKFYEYARGGVPEYWLLDPGEKWAEFYQLQEGRYYPIFSGRAGRYDSGALPGFWLRVEWLWQQPLPSPLRVLAEIVGMEPALAAAFERALAGDR
jgi:Uma2 family endonuclease